jgi:hypothetical protein
MNYEDIARGEDTCVIETKEGNIYSKIISDCHLLINEITEKVRPVLCPSLTECITDDREMNPEVKSELELELLSVKERLTYLSRDIKM